MPYIKQEMRDLVDPNIDALVEALAGIDDDDIEGVMNYTITELICRRIKPVGGWRYKWVNRVVGFLECIKLEFYRRIAANYENQCVRTNGDIEAYKGTAT